MSLLKQQRKNMPCGKRLYYDFLEFKIAKNIAKLDDFYKFVVVDDEKETIDNSVRYFEDENELCAL